MFKRLLLLIAIVVEVLGWVFFAAALIPDFGQAFSGVLCADGELVSQRSGSTGTSTEITCEFPDGSRTSVTGALIGLAVAGIVGGSLLFIAVIVAGMLGNARRNRRVLATGLPAQARVLDMRSTGTEINDQPLMKTRLQVLPPGEPSYETETQFLLRFGMLGSFGVGSTIPVKYDPAQREHVAIDWDALQQTLIQRGSQPVRVTMQAAPQSGTLTERLKQLEESYKAGLINADEYDDARERILKDL